MQRQHPAHYAVIAGHLADRASSWHIGTFGAVAEFHHSGEAVAHGAFEVDTPWGGIRIADKDCLLVAYELVSAHWARWQHGIAFCLTPDAALMNCRSSITPLGEDIDAIRSSERNHLLFDLGLGLPSIDFCVRTQDPELSSALTRKAGTDFLSNRSLYELLVAKSPQRVVISRLGRIEVRQQIPRHEQQTPAGSHTHLLPRLLRRSRTHAATVPIPPDRVPCLWLHPPHPIQDPAGLPQRFSEDAYLAFQALLAQYGDQHALRAKRMVFECLDAGDGPDHLNIGPASRHVRIAVRVALRQYVWLRGPSELLGLWRARFDGGESRGSVRSG